MEADPRPLTPESRARDRRPRGVPIALADGREWLLARGGTREALDPVRDAIFADVVLGGTVPGVELLWAGWALLMTNYDVTPAEAAGLLDGADGPALAEAVLTCLFGEAEGERERTWSRYVRVMLRANGLDPATVPPDELAEVLEVLVASGRAVPASRWVDAAKAAGRFREAREMAAAAAANGRPAGA